jgi:glycosyltransferase involved in cell wall biosynthesis
MLTERDMPFVSICIPTYNSAKFIKKTLLSIINQTYVNSEIIISDNASEDNTEEIVKSCQDKRIKYFRNPKNIGACANFNRCIELAKGEVVAIYHADDIYKHTIVEKEVEYLVTHRDAGAVFALDTIIDENGMIIGEGARIPKTMIDNQSCSFRDIFNALLINNYTFLVCPTFMAWKSVLKDVGHFEPKRYGDWVGGAADTYLWLKIAEKYNVGIINERLMFRREHAMSGTGQYVHTYITRSNHFRVLDSFLNSSAIGAGLEENIFEQYDFNKLWDDMIISRNMFNLDKKKEARTYLFRAMTWSRFCTSFRSMKNIVKLCVYGGLCIGVGMPFGGKIIKVSKSIRNILRKTGVA